MSIIGFLRKWWHKLFGVKGGDEGMYVYKPGFKLWQVARITMANADVRNTALFAKYVR